VNRPHDTSIPRLRQIAEDLSDEGWHTWAGTVSQVADELEERAMVSKTAAERKAAERARKRQSGLRPYELWLSLTELKAVRALLKRLRGEKRA